MATNLSLLAPEQGTYVINAVFTDEDSASVVPDSLTWTLTDNRGTVINSRLDVSATPAASVDILLTGADLDIDDGAERQILIEGTYTSTLGSGLPIKEQAHFWIDDFVGLS